ncbi:MAG: monovalent cation/H(+) antiporter subunit G [Candidatus Izemoplasma sp.]|nr:monovalent cation/H(+) antiporter subunit G [Candidatus Izemoplasma sp.]
MVIVSYIFMIIGGLFYLLGGLGILRMPDSFDRIQAGTKATTLGAFSLLIGIAIHHPDWWLKIGLIIIFIVLANPIGSSVLAKAAYRSFKKPSNLVVDELEELFGGETDA